MRWEDFPLPDGSYSDDTRPWSQQDVVNYLPTFAELPGTRSRLKLEPVPGLKPYAVVGDGPHRGARDVEGRAFVVSGNTLYRVTATGVAIPIGTIPGTGFVSMTHNQIAGGNELVIGTRDNSYVYNTVTDTLTATGVGLSSVDFLGQMVLGLSTDRRFWRHSALADATTYSDLDVYSAESAPDRLVGGIASQSEWLAFGERTIETYVNQPTENAAFQRVSGAVVEKGCANGNTIRRLDNSVFWLGDDLIVYRMQGYQPVPISTKAMATAFRACDPAKAFAFTYEDHGYVIYYLTFQDGQTWGYDVTNQRWHRRESFGLDRWRLNTLFKSNGEWYGGDYSNGNLYKLEWGYMFEGQAVMRRRLRTGVMHANGNRVFVHGLKILMDSGQPPSTSVEFPVQPTGPTITGTAQDGTTDVAYSFAYTPTAGDAPISRTVLRGVTLPAGWSWDEATATISAADPSATFISLSMRVYDTNGLYADHTDQISITQKTLLLVTGSAASVDAPMWAMATALGGDTTFAGIAQSTGADIAAGIPNYADGAFCVANNSAFRWSDNNLESAIGGGIDLNSGAVSAISGGVNGWVIKASPPFSTMPISASPPAAFVNDGPIALMTNGVNTINAASGIRAFSAGNYVYTTAHYYLMRAGDPRASWECVYDNYAITESGQNPNGFSIQYFFDGLASNDVLWCAVRWGFQMSTARYQIRTSPDWGAAWPESGIVFDKLGSNTAPIQLARTDTGVIVAYCTGVEACLRTSVDDFATVYPLGVGGISVGDIDEIAYPRLIACNGPYVYVLGRGENKVAVFDTMTNEVAAIVDVPITNARGIAAGAVT